MNSNKQSKLSKTEKEELKNRISRSIHKRSIKIRRLYLWGAAASILLCLTFGTYIFKSLQTPSILDYVNTNKIQPSTNSENVVLILNDAEVIQINEDSTLIEYSETGKNVGIGSKKMIHQKAIPTNEVIYNTLLVPFGKRSKIKLSDGSIVWLNSGSKLIYPSVFAGKEREVYLEGEAIFDVTHNPKKRFKVLTEGQEINVLGTVFNVSSYPNDNSVKTVLKSGSVQINYNKNASNSIVTISPGTMAEYHKKGQMIETKKVNIYDYFSWKDGILIFKNNDLPYIIAKLSRYYNVKISLKGNLKTKETFSGRLDLKNDVENVLNTLQETTNFEYSLNKNAI